MATVQKRGNSYKIVVSCGYDMNGKQIRKSTTYTPAPGMTAKQIEKEVDRQAVLFEEKCRNGTYLDGSIKFADFAEKWFTDYGEKHLKIKTLDRYKSLMERINVAIGHLSLEKIQPFHLMEFYKNLEEVGIKQDVKYLAVPNFKDIMKSKNYTMTKLAEMSGVSIATIKSCVSSKNISVKSAQLVSKALELDITLLFTQQGGDSKLAPKTILHYHRLISAILNTAVHWQILLSNPCDRVKPPKLEKKESKYLDEVQSMELMECLKKKRISCIKL